MSEGVIPRIDWMNQSQYFGQAAGLSSLPRRVQDGTTPEFTLGILRNHPVEITGRLVERFAGYLGVNVRVRVGDYDDSFAFGAGLADSDAVLVWPDWRRVPERSFSGVIENVKALGIPLGKILVVAPRVDEVREASASAVAGMLKSSDLRVYPSLPGLKSISSDHRMSALAGSDIPFDYHMLFASDIAVGWVGSLLTPPLKVVVVDLDNTLYSGVLGEDGPRGIRFERDHLEMLRILEFFRARGVLVCVSTRNDPRDVEHLHAVWPREGFALKDAAMIRSTWDDKGVVISQIISDLRTVPESVVFLDDNPGELANAVAKNPGLWPVLAESPAEALRIFVTQRHRIPSSTDTTGGARASDARAHEMRSRISSKAASMADLHAQLRTKISSWIADQPERERIVDIFLRTNQFNLALRRMDDSQVGLVLSDPDRDIVVASVSDRLSDSGIVAAIAVARDPDLLTVDELVISCRVLGRELETSIVSAMLSCVSEGYATARFTIARGPRNEPALRWLEVFTSFGDRNYAQVEISVLADAGRRILDSAAVTLETHRRQS